MQVTPSNFLVIGHLASVDDAHNGNEYGATHPYINITPNSYKFLEPKTAYDNILSNSHHKIRVYMGSITNDTPFKFSKDSETDSEKEQEIYWHYQYCTFIIRPSYHIGANGKIDIAGKSKCVYILDRHSNLTSNDTLTPVPIFSEDNTVNSIKDKQTFENALNNRQVIGDITVAPWPTDNKAYPDGVIWKQDDEEYYLYTDITVQNANAVKHSDLTFSERVSYGLIDTARVSYKFDKKDLYKDNFVYQNGIAFINYDRYIANGGSLVTPYDGINEITANSDKFMREGTSLYSAVGVTDLGENIHENGMGSSSDSNSRSYNEHAATIIREANSDDEDENGGTSVQSPATDDTESNSRSTSEDSGLSEDEKNKLNVDFIHKLEHLAYHHNPRLYYRREDLINFHTAMKCNGLVVLAGLSGTGKSALINLYAQALGLGPKQFKFIPVRPFWNDDSDLLGYVDTVHSMYRPAESGLVDTLIQASHHPDKLYLITFDEMNLARVEYYFSQFLSIMEKNPDDRYIQLYNPNLRTEIVNSNGYPARIKVGSNVLFTGTINLDESTHKFSDKVLDRSNIINLKLVPYFEDSKAKDVVIDDSIKSHKYTYRDFANMKDCNRSNGLTTNELKMLWQLHSSLNKANSNLGIGRRVINQINQYLHNMPKIPDEPVSHGEALDWQLVQRVITKVRGANSDIGRILQPKSEDQDNLIHILHSYSDISDFKESINELKRKYQEVRDYGFTV